MEMVMYHIIQVKSVNETTTFPEYHTKYRVVGSKGTVYLETHSEDKAFQVCNKMQVLAGMREH
tara:strand:+ start:1545 stop:1733 length:189 start_codon:yes stop_codon:yes gene_type:complete